jgi:hypothetical protein
MNVTPHLKTKTVIFRNVVFSGLLEYGTVDKVQKPQ